MRLVRHSCALAAVVAAAALVPTSALAHVERPSYWPDPAPDCSVKPCTGGKVPAERSLATALDPKRVGHTRVVCQPDSLTRLEASVAKARKSGFFVRPTDHRTLSVTGAQHLLSVNRQLFALCAYHEIQPAITASGNNDRVVIMPGLCTEPTSRAMPTLDPACQQYLTHSDSGDPGA